MGSTPEYSNTGEVEKDLLRADNRELRHQLAEAISLIKLLKNSFQDIDAKVRFTYPEIIKWENHND